MSLEHFMKLKLPKKKKNDWLVQEKEERKQAFWVYGDFMGLSGSVLL